jgi:hypothetical protein
MSHASSWHHEVNLQFVSWAVAAGFGLFVADSVGLAVRTAEGPAGWSRSSFSLDLLPLTSS